MEAVVINVLVLRGLNIGVDPGTIESRATGISTTRCPNQLQSADFQTGMAGTFRRNACRLEYGTTSSAEHFRELSKLGSWDGSARASLSYPVICQIFV